MLWWFLLACTSGVSHWMERPDLGRAVMDAKAERLLRYAGPEPELIRLSDGEVLGTWEVFAGAALLPRDEGAPLVLDDHQGLSRLGDSGQVEAVWGREDGYPSGVKMGTMAWIGSDEREIVLSGSRWLTHRYNLDTGEHEDGVVPAQGDPAVIVPSTGEVVSRHRKQDGVLFGWSAVEERDLWVLKRELDQSRSLSRRYSGLGGPYNPEVFVRVSPDGETIATAGYSDVVNIVDPVNAFVTAYLTAPWVEMVTSVDWSARGTEVLVGYGDGRAAVFQASDGEVLWTGSTRDELYRHGELRDWAWQRVHRPQDLFTLPVLAMGLQEDGTVVVAVRSGVLTFPQAVTPP